MDRLENRLKELLQFARPSERQSEVLDVNAVLRGTLRMMAGRLARTGLVVEECLAPVLPPTLGDAVLFEQVFMSLISNAAEALPASAGVITLTTGTAQDKAGAVCVFVEVRDTGVGILPERLVKIFVPFYTTKSQGTGLGLAIARKFTEAYSGTISVASRPGEGASSGLPFQPIWRPEPCHHPYSHCGRRKNPRRLHGSLPGAPRLYHCGGLCWRR